MPRTKHSALRRPTMSYLALALLLLTASAAPAQRPLLPPDEQQAVNNAIDRGVAYLKRTQLKNGTWAKPKEKGVLFRHFLIQNYQAGYAALPGLTLLECGVPPDDPIVQQAAHFVRSKAAKMDLTYELALSILFLDRLGDPKDKKTIQTLALRLIAGQSATGGWGYRCPLLSGPVQMELLTALRHLDPPAEHAPGLAAWPVKRPGEMAPVVQAPGAPLLEGMIARPGAPLSKGGIARDRPDGPPSAQDLAGPSNRCRDCLGLTILDNWNAENTELEREAPAGPKVPRAKPIGQAGNGKTLDTKAAPPKSSKPYVIPERIAILPVAQDPDLLIMQDPMNQSLDPMQPTTDNSNTQFAILALWRSQQYEVPVRRSLNLIARRFRTSQNADGSWGYHYRFGGGDDSRALTMTCVGLIGLAVGHGLAQPKPGGQLVQDPRIINGLIALSANVGQPVKGPAKPPMHNLYFLWSLERVAVLYNLPAIGAKDWYRWGAQVLVRNQEDEGNWNNGLYIGSSPPLDTCLALLFLKRANLVKDLTAKLPFSAAELNEGITEKQTLLPKPTPTQKTKKTILPEGPPKTAELDKPIIVTSSPPLYEDTTPVNENSGGSKKKWVVVSLVFFVIFAGGSAIFLLAARRRNGEVEEARDGKQKKRTNKRKQRSTT